MKSGKPSPVGPLALALRHTGGGRRRAAALAFLLGAALLIGVALLIW